MTAFPPPAPPDATLELRPDVDADLLRAEAELARDEAHLLAEAARLATARSELEVSVAEVRALVEEARGAHADDDELGRRSLSVELPSLAVGQLLAPAREARAAAVKARHEAVRAVKEHLAAAARTMGALSKAVEHDRTHADRAVVRAAARQRSQARARREAGEVTAPDAAGTADTVVRPAVDVARALRISPRVKMQAAVDLESDSNFFTGFSSNISDGGLFVATVNFLAVGTPVDLTFTLPSGQRVEAHGEVRWIREIDARHPDAFPGMGIRFLELAEADRAAITSFVESRDPMFYVD